MPFDRITLSLTVDKKDTSEITETLLAVIDSFVTKRKAVFDSDICTQRVAKVHNATEIRREIWPDKS